MSIWTPPEPYKIKSDTDNSTLCHTDTIQYQPLKTLGIEEYDILNMGKIISFFKEKRFILCNANTAVQLFLCSERIALVRPKSMHIILFPGTIIESPEGRLGIPELKNISGTNKYFKWFIDTLPLDEPVGAVKETFIAFY